MPENKKTEPLTDTKKTGTSTKENAQEKKEEISPSTSETLFPELMMQEQESQTEKKAFG